MRQFLLVVIFLMANMTFAWADGGTTVTNVTVTGPNGKVNGSSPDACLNNSNYYVQQSCEQMRQANQNNGDNTTITTSTQTIGPYINPMPAWQQALQPQTTTTTNQQNTTTTQGATTESTTSTQSSTHSGGP